MGPVELAVELGGHCSESFTMVMAGPDQNAQPPRIRCRSAALPALHSDPGRRLSTPAGRHSTRRARGGGRNEPSLSGLCGLGNPDHREKGQGRGFAG